MGLRMTFGGKPDHDERHSMHYTEGYNAGYNSAMEEAARNRTRVYPDRSEWEERMEEMESRRRRARATDDEINNRMREAMREYMDELETESRRRRSRGDYEEMNRPQDDVHWPLGENRQMGFAHPQAHGGGGHMAHHMATGMAETAKKLDPRLAAVLESAVEVMENPPSTWTPYIHRKDYHGIAKMEGKELMTAIEEKKPIADIRKELTHTIAALFQMISAK